MRFLVTGGAGFIGSNFLRLIAPRHPEHQFLNLDKLTYAGNPLNLRDLEGAPNYEFVRADIADASAVTQIFERYQPEGVVHFAAETHVDRSILDPATFLQANLIGTFHLLEACRSTWQSFEGKLFHHVSTDEVYGSLGEADSFTEATPYDPSSPYSATKAGADHLVRAYHRTYGFPSKITNCSNNYGPYQFPEKMLPLMILNAVGRKPLPIYGSGLNVRDWLYVEDHCEAIWTVIEKGKEGETYNIGGNCEKTNLQVLSALFEVLFEETGTPAETYQSQITFVPDRPGHDLRYAIDASKIREELGWFPTETFESGLRKTVRWYLQNTEWVEQVRSGEYQRWISQNYEERENTLEAVERGPA